MTRRITEYTDQSCHIGGVRAVSIDRQDLRIMGRLGWVEKTPGGSLTLVRIDIHGNAKKTPLDINNLEIALSRIKRFTSMIDQLKYANDLNLLPIKEK